MPRNLTLAALFILSLLSSSASAWDRGQATRFATLPKGTAHPEGIAVDAAGNVYVADFDVDRTAGPGHIVVFDPSGRHPRVISVADSSNLLLGLDFHSLQGGIELLVIDFGAKNVLRVDPRTGASSLFTTIPGGAGAGPNALTFDESGNVYISDSFQGIIWQTGPGGGAPVVWAQSPLLTTTGVPPFGANGLAFNKCKKCETALFVANTGNDTVAKIPVATRVAEVFVNGINGADGLAIDDDDNIWVVANQSDEIVVVEPVFGRVIAKLGDFDGLSQDRAPVGLLFPASLAFHGDQVYVTNLSLDLRLFNPAFNAVDSQWASEVRRHTVARLPRRIPPVARPQGDDD
ncbi:MAG TPA: SMP-30/gluconolactonase/LRE family protein [Myxococcales bacterium]|nr:SMP-30/gluconolactonase/LRE family protein [Myxococcales bacterium]